MKDIVVFKSQPLYYEKELQGLKPNTTRLRDKDRRFKILARWAKTGRYGLIKTVNTHTGDSFTREVTDVSYIAKWVIISWRGPGL